MSNIDYSKTVTQEKALAITRERLLSLLSELRKSQEEVGCVLPNGTRMQTDRASRAELTAQLMLRQQGVSEGPVYWKSLQGWVTLSEDMLGQTLWQVSTHVQACFKAEQLVAAEIETGKLSCFDDIKATFAEYIKTALVR